MASLYKTYLQREEYIYKNLHFKGFTNHTCILPLNDSPPVPSPMSFFFAQLNGPKSTQMQLKNVKTGQPVLQFLYSKPMCNIHNFSHHEGILIL